MRSNKTKLALAFAASLMTTACSATTRNSEDFNTWWDNISPERTQYLQSEPLKIQQ